MFIFHSIESYHQSLLNGQTSCEEAVLHYFEKIKQDAHLNAWLEIYEEEALIQAKKLDESRLAGKTVGKLHGVITGLKDVICYKGHKVSASSLILENFTSLYNATATQQLLNEDAIIIGRQNCDEFAMGGSNENSAYGHVKNPNDVERVSGGSSGGSAVAVKAGHCMISLGSDTGGSVRQPADFCGVIGMKPTYGTISRYGLIAYASSFDQIGIFANSIEDVSLVLDVISGADEFDSTAIQENFIKQEVGQTKEKFKICYFKNAIEHTALDKNISNSIKGFIDKLSSEGHAVEAINFDLLEYIVPTYYILTTAEASSNLSRFDGVKYGYRNKNEENDLLQMYKLSRSEGFGAEVKRRILLGTFVLSEGYYDAYFTKAQQVRKLLIDETTSIFEKYDAIILPTSPTPAFKIGEMKDPIEIFLADIYTVFANLVGIPAISIPLFKTPDGLPFGLQVMADKKNDLLLLSISKKMMEL